MLMDDHKTKRMGSALKFILDHPPSSPDIAPSDFHLFLHLTKHLVGKKFDDDDEMQEEVMTWFKGQAEDFYD